MTTRADQERNKRNKRKRAKRVARRAEHMNKYSDELMKEKVAVLVAHFNGEEADNA